ncbi:hypothetical protein DRO61_10325, partial [Candidatus Bathyarchaeota archaeon]
MAKVSKIRAVETESELRSLVDSGHKLDNEIKNLQFRSEAVKSSILSLSKDGINEDEKSIRLIAEKSYALVTRAEKVEFSKNEDYLDLLKAVEAGNAPSELTFKEEYKLTKNIDEVLQLLEENGLLGSLDKKTTIAMKPEVFKGMSKT